VTEASTDPVSDALALVVNDDPAIRASLHQALTEAGFDVVEATDGESALEVFGVEDLAVILLGAHLADVSGAGLVAQIRARPEGRTLPVILVTDGDDLDECVGGLDAGADDYVVTAIEVPELVARVRAQVRRSAAWAEWVAALERRLDAVVLLRRIRYGADATTIASSVCDELLGQGDLAAVGIVAFHGSHNAVSLSGAGAWSGWFDSGEALTPSLARTLLRAVARGPRIVRADARRTAQPPVTGLPQGSGKFDVALAPIWGSSDEPLGLLAIAFDPDGELNQAGSILASAIDFCSILTALLGPELQHQASLELARAELLELVDTKAFTPVFQPVVELTTGALVGVEALTRWDDGIRPDLRFGEAHELGIGIEVERATITQSLRAAPPLPDGIWLSINASPALVLSGALDELLGGVSRPLVLELTEHEPVDDYEKLRAALALHPDLTVAVDDAGAGYSSLRHVLDLQPGIVKLDINWVHEVETDPARQALITAMVGFAREMGILVVAEGIETPAERHTLIQLGVVLGQGFLYAHPAPADELALGALTPLS
jgi:EAL domain-containing protein (putative c-di-GMP-specific phosphodiesterase class I)/CheY-like chemotaxis protein